MIALVEFLNKVDWMVLFGAVLVIGSIVIFVRMSRDRRSTFDFAEMFRGEDGRTSMSKFSAFLGTLASTWVVIAYAASKELTDTIFATYLGILVAGKVASEFVAAKKVEAADKARAGIVDPPPAAPPAPIILQAMAAPVADPIGRGTPEKPLHVALDDDEAPKLSATMERRPLGKHSAMKG